MGGVTCVVERDAEEKKGWGGGVGKERRVCFDCLSGIEQPLHLA